MRDDDVEILLITTRKKRRWSVPKGWPIKHGTPQQTAAIEAYEESRRARSRRQKAYRPIQQTKGEEKAVCDVRRPNLSARGNASAG
jgi:ADP-ribose pyrophosphatase YjhB (NUDIX family)